MSIKHTWPVALGTTALLFMPREVVSPWVPNLLLIFTVLAAYVAGGTDQMRADDRERLVLERRKGVQ